MRKVLEQKVVDAVARRDAVVASFKKQLNSEQSQHKFVFHLAHIPNRKYGENKGLVDFAYQLVQEQGCVDSAKKELYIWLRANGEDVQHKDL